MSQLLPSEHLKKGWTQSHYAVTKDGRDVATGHHAAVAWCLEGAFWPHIAEDALDTFIGLVVRHTGLGPTYWNDKVCLTQAEAVTLAQKVEREMGLS